MLKSGGRLPSRLPDTTAHLVSVSSLPLSSEKIKEGRKRDEGGRKKERKKCFSLVLATLPDEFSEKFDPVNATADSLGSKLP